MGTRADFYVGRGKNAEWIGSIAYDGYPDASNLENVVNAKDEDSYRTAVNIRLSELDSTRPHHGWPWPWDDSNTSDHAYAWDEGKVWCFGSYQGGWFDPAQQPPWESSANRIHGDFPDMSARKNVTLGPRSGVMVLGVPKAK